MLLMNNRINRLCITTSLLGCIVSLALRTRADATADEARKTLQSLYDQTSKAVALKDVKGATAIDEPNYTFLDVRGITHKPAEVQQIMTKLLQQSQTLQVTMRIDSVTLQGKSATVDAHQHVYRKYIDLKTHRTVIYDQWEEATDTWIRHGASWRRAHSKARALRIYMNGKQVYRFPAGKSGQEKRM